MYMSTSLLVLYIIILNVLPQNKTVNFLQTSVVSFMSFVV